LAQFQAVKDDVVVDTVVVDAVVVVCSVGGACVVDGLVIVLL